MKRNQGVEDFKRAAGLLMFVASSLAALKTLADLTATKRQATPTERLLSSINRRLAGALGPDEGNQATETGTLDFEDLFL